MKKNLWLKVLVLVIAIFLWVQQVLLRTQTEEIQVPVFLQNIPSNLVQVNSELAKIPVTISGRGLEILQLHFSEYSFQIDASNFKDGENLVEISEQQLKIPPQRAISVKSINLDSKLTIEMDKIITARKKIEFQFQSSKDEEYFIKNKLTAANKEVKVSGPSEVLKNISSVLTEKISKNMVENGKLNVNLQKPDPRVELETTQLSLNVKQTKIVTKTISLIPIEFPYDIQATIIPQKVSAMLSGPEEILDSLNNRNVVAKLKKEEVLNNRYVDVYFELPTGVKLLDYTPQSIQVTKENE
ncbi:MAG TPA: hypothetical protein DHM37_05300 [Candidatus Cloacimonas sp.]|jgi:ribosomal protein L21|nr:hypothetical protein [Candidatus Cloacimonadota bacterium]HCX73117.1 hypothetical protein [Candidatus Cloacimonas sp.]